LGDEINSEIRPDGIFGILWGAGASEGKDAQVDAVSLELSGESIGV
jgi:hypothetical protein